MKKLTLTVVFTFSAELEDPLQAIEVADTVLTALEDADRE